MTRRTLLLVAALAAALPLQAAEPIRERRNFDDGWRFHKGDVTGGERPDLSDASWRRLRLPHDWSIEGPYSASNASGTGFLPGGIGWYRKTFRIPESLSSRKLFIEFDGVYRSSDVWINGHHVGRRPYGYSSFEYDLTPHLNFGAQPNVLAVRVDHSVAADSRFYTGSGIYRHVWLTIARPLHVAHWGAFVSTPVVTQAEALVSIETSVVNESRTAADVKVVTALVDAGGREVASVTAQERLAPGTTRVFAQQGSVERPRLWSLSDPYLYSAVTHIYAGTAASDEYRTAFGIRTIRFDPDRGFFLNGQSMKLKGVCLHHDLGALGAAFSEAALERRLKILKDLGVNAVRCSHNPMAPEEYDLCDRLGLLVMDEAFDEWTGGKHKWVEGWNTGTASTRGYHEDFDQWSARDLEDMVLRDRNHPSIVLWSIGNEIDYPGDPFGHPKGRDGLKPGMQDADVLPMVARRLIGEVKSLDGSRPVTQALADINASNAAGLAELLDVAGYIYLEQFYERDHAAWPGRVILGSENSRSLAAWRPVAVNDYVAGQFLWTGIDFLGEAPRYPSRGSSAGLLDICGFRKPDAYLREALWSDRPMVYAAAQEAPAPAAGNRGRILAEHWNWAGDARQAIPVEVYTNCTSAELFLNGQSQGEKRVEDRLQPVLRWDVPNQPGVVRVIAKRDGAEAAHYELATAGPAAALELAPDKSVLEANGDDLASIEIRVVDASGRRVYLAAGEIRVEVTGAGALAALDSGDARNLSPVQTDHRKPYQGRALALVRAGVNAGPIVVKASSPELKGAELTLNARQPAPRPY